MATITHLYDIDQTVWVLDASTGIKEAVVLKIDATKTLSATDIEYQLKIVDDNTQVESAEENLYATLSGVGSALEAYEALLVA